MLERDEVDKGAVKEGIFLQRITLIDFNTMKVKPSTFERMMLRLIEYMLRAYREQFKTSDKLSVVVPIVIYNGVEEWKEETQFIKYFLIDDDQ